MEVTKAKQQEDALSSSVRTPAQQVLDRRCNDLETLIANAIIYGDPIQANQIDLDLSQRAVSIGARLMAVLSSDLGTRLTWRTQARIAAELDERGPSEEAMRLGRDRAMMVIRDAAELREKGARERERVARRD